jgi:hypothetical protein
VDRSADKTAEERSRSSAIETMVVVKNSYPH